MAKTLKQMADELGVSKQRLYRYVKQENISEAYQESNTMYYDETTEETIKAVFLTNEVHHETLCDAVEVPHDVHQKRFNNMNEAHHETVEILHDTVSEALKHNERIIEALQNALSVMQQQLTACQQELEKRDHQIEQLQAALEEECQHNHETSDKLAQLADQAQQLQLMQMRSPELPDKSQKQNFWKRIFKKNN